MSPAIYDIGQADQFGWFDDMVRLPVNPCKVCGSDLVRHMYGPTLWVCPTCFPEETA